MSRHDERLLPEDSVGESESKPLEELFSGDERSSGELGKSRAFLLTLAYDGSRYCGWQLQPDHLTVQQVVEGAVAKTLGVPFVRVHASSRTDTGVHALGQAVVFRTSQWTAAADRLPFAINTKLPADVVVRAAREVPLSFHPLRHTLSKRYRYQVFSSRINDPLSARQHWWVRRQAVCERMVEAAKLLEGRHDFASFQSTGSPRSSTVRTVHSLSVRESQRLDGRLIQIDIEADGFLYNMVRNIVGTLVQIGVGREEPDWARHVLESKDRTIAGATAPPQGLVLMGVVFNPQEIELLRSIEQF
jgi:tRNA pseudouridine38-40 synthase